jgi:sterol desaturase/sphingolipid hydroxylase (fatty acid hydroxylase superfamily)
MVRGIVYSLSAVCLFLLASIAWMSLRNPPEEALYLMSGWLILACFFVVGPLFFALGYWHHRHLHPQDPQWDAELGE